MIIKNKAELSSHGNVEARRMVLDILEAGLAAGDPYDNMRKVVRVEDGKLIIGNDAISPRQIVASQDMNDTNTPPLDPLVFDLSKIGKVYLVGGGKAAQRQAKAIEDALGNLIAEGQVNAKQGDEIALDRIHVTLAGHPIPDEESVSGAERILAIERKAKRGDIVLFSESGGGSALMTLPAPGLTLQDVQDVNRILYFEHGAPMPVANAVRGLLVTLRSKHSRHVGDATLIRFSTDERPPNMRVFVNTPRPDVDAFAYAIELLKQYGCWDEVPESVRRYLLKADPSHGPLRPAECIGRPHYSLRVMGPEYMLDAAQRKGKELGLNTTVAVSSLSNVEALAIGEASAYVAQEIETFDRPIQTPCALLCGGELVVTTGKVHGLGGRNQEFVLAGAPRIEGSRRIVIASADSDGNDGPTDYAGGIVDGYTMARARAAGFDVFQELRRHNTSTVLQAVGDAILTGVQKTNVQDLRVVYVGLKEV